MAVEIGAARKAGVHEEEAAHAGAVAAPHSEEAAAVARRAASPPRMEVELLPKWCDVEDTRFDVLSRTPWPTLEVLRCQEPPPRTLRDFLPLDVPEDWLGELLLDAKERPEIGRHVRVSAPIVHVDAEVSADATLLLDVCVNCSKLVKVGAHLMGLFNVKQDSHCR